MRCASRVVLAVILVSTGSVSGSSSEKEDPSTQFDFLVGAWKMELTKVLPDGRRRSEGPRYSLVTPVLGGAVLLDRWSDGGFTLRSFDPKEGKWRLFWTDPAWLQGRIQFWEGAFEKDRATFVGGDSFPELKGSVFSKIIFSEITDRSCRWEMFLTRDGGETWRLDWIREYSKIEIEEEDGRFASLQRPRRHRPDFDWLIGNWTMAYTQIKPDGERRWIGEQPAVVTSLLGGKALLDVWNDYGLTIRTFDPRAKKWRFFWTDRGPSRGRLTVWEGTVEGDRAEFLGGYSMPSKNPHLSTRIVFSSIRQNSCHWEMFRTPDGGKKWILTDIREYRRRP